MRLAHPDIAAHFCPCIYLPPSSFSRLSPVLVLLSNMSINRCPSVVFWLPLEKSSASQLPWNLGYGSRHSITRFAKVSFYRLQTQTARRSYRKAASPFDLTGEYASRREAYPQASHVHKRH